MGSIPFWLVGEFTAHFRTYFSGDWDVRWGYRVLTHGHTQVPSAPKNVEFGWEDTRKLKVTIGMYVFD